MMTSGCVLGHHGGIPQVPKIVTVGPIEALGIGPTPIVCALVSCLAYM